MATNSEDNGGLHLLAALIMAEDSLASQVVEPGSGQRGFTIPVAEFKEPETS